MNVTKPTRRGILVAALMVLGAACSRTSLGATTTCSTYEGLSSADQQAAVSNMQAARGESTSSVSVAEVSVSAYCLLHSGSSEIQGVYGG